MNQAKSAVDFERLTAGTVTDEVGPRHRGWSFVRSKHALDCLVAVTLLTLFAPFIALAALAIELTSPGAAFFVQWRVGRHGRLFRMFKLRTMATDAEVASGPVWSTEADPRITVIGRILRATHLDELPQLINVLKGEMSLVGPRPERPMFVKRLTREIPHYAARLEIRPGITGLAQVCQAADQTMEDVKSKLAFDLTYIRRMGWWIDARILVATVGKALHLRAPRPIVAV